MAIDIDVASLMQRTSDFCPVVSIRFTKRMLRRDLRLSFRGRGVHIPIEDGVVRFSSIHFLYASIGSVLPVDLNIRQVGRLNAICRTCIIDICP